MEVKKGIESITKQLRKVAWFWMLLSMFLFLNGGYQLWTAKDNAEYIAIHKELPWGKKRNETNIEAMSSVPYLELDLLDSLHSIACITIGMAFFAWWKGGIACEAFRTKAKVATTTEKKRLACKSVWTFVFFLGLYGWAKKDGKAFLNTFEKIKEQSSLDYKEYQYRYLLDW